MVLVFATCSEFGIEYPLVSNHGKQSPIDHFPIKTLLNIMRKYVEHPQKISVVPYEKNCPRLRPIWVQNCPGTHAGARRLLSGFGLLGSASVPPKPFFFGIFFFAIINMEHVDLARYLQ